MLMLRNLVTSLFEHEQIKTTLPKARDTARLAEKIITMGKKGDNGSYNRASSFLLKPLALTKLFETFSQRYADRPGGYTRIHKFGNRPGDNAPHAILELVDSPRDLRWELTSRAIGWEILKDKLKNKKPEAIINAGAQQTLDVVKVERDMQFNERGILRPKTRWALQKILKFRNKEAISDLSEKATEYVDELLATPLAFRSIHEEMLANNIHAQPPRRKAGQKLFKDTQPALVVAQGRLAAPNTSNTTSPPKSHNKLKRRGPVFSFENALTRDFQHT